jgi:hypothetical protein
MRSPFPKRKSRLSEQAKAIVAAQVLLDVRDERLDAGAAGLRLRAAVGLQWTFLSAVQYLSGKSAIAAITALTGDWTEAGRTKAAPLGAILVAADIVANVRPDGEPLCASELAKQLKAPASAGV